MNAIFTPIKNFFKKLDQPIFSTAENSDQANNESYKYQSNPRNNQGNKSNQLLVSDRDFFVYSNDSGSYIKFGIDSNKDPGGISLGDTMKNSYQHVYPNIENLNANLHKNYNYQGNGALGAQQRESLNSSLETLNSAQLNNVIHSSIMNDNQVSRIQIPQRKSIQAIKYQSAPVNSKTYSPKPKIVSNVSQPDDDLPNDYSAINGRDSAFHQYSLTESDDDSFMNLVYNMKENRGTPKKSTVDMQSISLTSKIPFNYPTRDNENTLPLNIADPSKDLLKPIQIEEIQSCIHEESSQSAATFYSFSSSKKYEYLPENFDQHPNVIADKFRREAAQTSMPLTERLEAQFNRRVAHGQLPKKSGNYNNIITEKSEISDGSRSTRIKGKFKISQTEFSKLLKKSIHSQSDGKKNVEVSILDDTVPDFNSREQVEIRKLTPKFKENLKFASENTASKYMSLPNHTEPYYETQPSSYRNRRLNTMPEYLPTDNYVLCMNCNDMIATNLIDQHSLQCCDKSSSKKEEFIIDEPVPSTKIVDCNSKLEKLSKNLKINVQKVEMGISDYSLDNEDLICAYIDLACDRVKEIISNNNSIAKLRLDIDSLKNIKEYLQPIIRIPMISLVIANIEMIVLIAGDKEASMEVLRDISVSITSRQKITKKPAQVPSLHIQTARTMTQQELNNIIPGNRMQYASSVLSPSHYNNGLQLNGFLSDNRQNKKTADWVNYRVNKEDHESLKSSFCGLALEYRNLLPKNHPGRNKVVDELFDDVIEKNIPESSWHRYLIEEFNKVADRKC